MSAALAVIPPLAVTLPVICKSAVVASKEPVVRNIPLVIPLKFAPSPINEPVNEPVM